MVVTFACVRAHTHTYVYALGKVSIYHWRQLDRGTMEDKGLYLVLDESPPSLLLSPFSSPFPSVTGVYWPPVCSTIF